MLDFICMAPVDLTGAHRTRKKYKIKNSYLLADSNPQHCDLKSDALPTELTGLFYINDLYVYLYFLYQCILSSSIMKWILFCLVNVLIVLHIGI